jgi:hypothetical protein
LLKSTVISRSSPTRDRKERESWIDRNADEWNRHCGHRFWSSETVRTVFEADQRGKASTTPRICCVADIQHGTEKCAGQSAIDWSMGNEMSQPNLEGTKIPETAQRETKRTLEKTVSSKTSENRAGPRTNNDAAPTWPTTIIFSRNSVQV